MALPNIDMQNPNAGGSLPNLTLQNPETGEYVDVQMQIHASDEASAAKAEAWAVGERGGVPVSNTDQTYHNNAKYYAQVAEDAAETASAAYGTDLLAPTYSASKTYAIGDHVIYNGGYYACNTAITTAEAWTAAHWTKLAVGEEVTDLKSALRDSFIYPASDGTNTRNGITIQTNGKLVTLNGTATNNVCFALNTNGLRSASGHTTELYNNDSTFSNIVSERRYLLHRKLIEGTVTKGSTTYTPETFIDFTDMGNVVNAYLLKRGSSDVGYYLKSDESHYNTLITDQCVGILDVFIYNGVVCNNAVFEIWVEEVIRYSMGNEILSVNPYLCLDSSGNIIFETANVNYPSYLSQKVEIPEGVIDGQLIHNGSGNGDYAAIAFLDSTGTVIGVGTNGKHLTPKVGIPSGATHFILSSFTGNESPYDVPDNFFVRFILSKEAYVKQMGKTKSKNHYLVDLKANAIPMSGSEISTSSGTVTWSSTSNYTATRFIKLPQNHLGIIGTYAYTASGKARVAFYDENKDFISAISNNNKRVKNTTIPTNAVYVRLGTHTTIPYTDAFAYILCAEEPVDEKSTEPLVSEFYNPATITANHRGFNTIAPENTLPAFKLSKQNGFSMVETDIRVTSDGQLVLLHDYSINRTARNADGTEVSGTVNISDITYEQALTYDFGIWKGQEYAGTKIPLLEEALLLCNRLGLSMVLEIEATGKINSKYVRDIVKAVDQCGMRGKVIYACFQISFLKMVLDYDDTAYVAAISSTEYTAETFPISGYLQLKTGKNQVCAMINTPVLNDGVIDLLRTNQIAVDAWLVNSVATALTLNPYVTIFTSDSVNVTEELKNYYMEH